MRYQLRLLRIRKGVSLETASREMNMSLSTLTHIELGKRPGNITIWKKIQNYYGIPSTNMWNVINE